MPRLALASAEDSNSPPHSILYPGGTGIASTAARTSAWTWAAVMSDGNACADGDGLDAVTPVDDRVLRLGREPVDNLFDRQEGFAILGNQRLVQDAGARGRSALRSRIGIERSPSR
jgi:hypothetical protein